MLDIKENYILRDSSTFKIGGKARYFVEIKSQEDLQDAFDWVSQKDSKWAILAGGSNVLIGDSDFGGLVIKLVNNSIDIKGDRIECGAGASLAKTVNMAVGVSLAGLEWAAGIPGSVGGAIRGNAGAYGSEISGIIENVVVYNIQKKRFDVFSTRDCQFEYRSSIFKNEDYIKDYIIWSAVLKLNKGNSDEIRQKITEYIESRSKNQPNLPSAGCVFKNLRFSDLKNANPRLAELAEDEKVVRGGMVAAGWIIDMLDMKGKSVGGAKVSLEHANFIVNTGGATAEDVVMLVSIIKQKVRDRYKIQLQEEIQYFNF